MIAMIKKPSTKEFWVLDEDLKQIWVNEPFWEDPFTNLRWIALAILCSAGHAGNCDILRAEANPVIRSGGCEVSKLPNFSSDIVSGQVQRKSLIRMCSKDYNVEMHV